MLSKGQRLNRTEFTTARKQGVTIHHTLFSLFIGNSPDTKSHFSIVVSSKVAKTAVSRNTIRRRVYTCLEKVALPAPKSYIVYAKGPIVGAKTDLICDSLTSLIISSSSLRGRS